MDEGADDKPGYVLHGLSYTVQYNNNNNNNNKHLYSAQTKTVLGALQ